MAANKLRVQRPTFTWRRLVSPELPDSTASASCFAEALELRQLLSAAPIVYQPAPGQAKEIWTTSVYSYANDGNPYPGGGLENDELRVGGWGDQYDSLLQFDLSGLPQHATSAVLRLFDSSANGGTPVGMSLNRITQGWDWQTMGTGRDHERLWWADRPPTLQWGSTALAAPTPGTWYEIDVTDLFNAWQSGTVSNYGLELQPLGTNDQFNIFDSSSYLADPTLRPELVITPAEVAPAAPQHVIASDGTFDDHVHISWDAVPGADSYEIWRNTINDTNTATQIGSGVTNLTFDDTAAALGQTYYYWVKTVSGNVVSDFSAGDTGSSQDRTPPQAELSDPQNGGIIDRKSVNSRGYIDVTFSDGGGSGIDPDTITDSAPEFSLSGNASAGVVVAGDPFHVAGTTYRYVFMGTFADGQVTVNFAQGAWADRAGNVNTAFTATFTIAPSDSSSLAPLGSLSERYESQGAGPGTISSGKGDAGGKSYGVYQFSSTQGVVAAFVNEYYPTQFASLVVGSTEFDAEWHQLANQNAVDFRNAQYLFVEQNYYDVQVAKLQLDIGLDVTNRSRALQNVVWSTAVQHGAYTRLIAIALSPLLTGAPITGLSDSDIITAIYAERSRTNPDGTLYWFSSSSKQVQQEQLVRFRHELRDALAELASEVGQ